MQFELLMRLESFLIHISKIEGTWKMQEIVTSMIEREKIHLRRIYGPRTTV